MSQKKVVGLDMDGVLMDTTPGFLAYYNQLYGTSWEKADIYVYDMYKVFGVEAGLVRGLYNDFILSLNHEAALPIGDVVETLLELQNKCKFIVITARGEAVRHPTEKWLQEKFGNIFDNYILTGLHEISDSRVRNKGQIAQELGVDVFVEDSLSNALDILAHGIPVFLYDSPWNQTKELPSGITRVYNWDEIHSLL